MQRIMFLTGVLVSLCLSDAAECAASTWETCPPAEEVVQTTPLLQSDFQSARLHVAMGTEEDLAAPEAPNASLPTNFKLLALKAISFGKSLPLIHMKNPGGSAKWIGKLFAAYWTSIVVSSDDVLWLLPFAVCNVYKIRFMLLYVFMVLVLAIFSCCLVDSAFWLGHKWPNAPVDKIMYLASAALLSLYTISLFWEWHQGEKEGDDGNEAQIDEGSIPEAQSDEGSVPERAPERPADEVAEKAASESQPHAPHTSELRTCRAIVTIVCVGSFDNIAIWLAMLMAGMYDGWQLCIGAVLAALTVVAVCCAVGSFKIVVKVIEMIPLWAILGVVSVFSIFEAVMA